jgi:hypothetical protein
MYQVAGILALHPSKEMEVRIMATLTAQGFSLGLTIARAKDNWPIYQFSVLCGDKPVLNYQIYRGISPTLPKKWRPIGCNAWSASETLIPTLEWIRDNNRALSWQSTEPSAKLAVYPDDVFPLAPAHHEVIVAGDDESPFEFPRPHLEVNQIKLYEMNPSAGVEQPAGRHPSDPFCVILRINSATFTGDGAYSNTGPAMILQTTRREFTRFIRDLKREYRALPKRKARSKPKRARPQTLAQIRDLRRNPTS